MGIMVTIGNSYQTFSNYMYTYIYIYRHFIRFQTISQPNTTHGHRTTDAPGIEAHPGHRDGDVTAGDLDEPADGSTVHRDSRPRMDAQKKTWPELLW